jgi:hypothetical protein
MFFCSIESARKKFIKEKNDLWILLFPISEYMTHICPLSKNLQFSDILRERFDHVFDNLCFVEKKLARADQTITKTMEVNWLKYFKVKHNDLKNTLHGQILSDFEKVSFKMLGKTWTFLNSAPPRASEKKCLLDLLQEKANHGTSAAHNQ